MPVPPGAVLKVDFFSKWFDELKKTAEWNTFAKSTSENASSACAALKQKSLELTFSTEQLASIDYAIGKIPNAKLYAVRSSSPEEDLEGHSFAGAYLTVLGVNRAGLDDAVRRCIAS